MSLPAIWFRRLHRWLAGTISAGLLMALVSGAALSWNATSCHVQEWVAEEDALTLSVAEVVLDLESSFITLDEMEVNTCGQWTVTGQRQNGAYGNWGLRPSNCELSHAPTTANWVKWMTSLHRSLFMGTLGRLFVGLTAVLFLLLLVTGAWLTLKVHGFTGRSTGMWHVDLGSLVLVPCAILAFTGVAMSAHRFGLWPDSPPLSLHAGMAEQRVLPAPQFEVFENMPLAALQNLKWPFALEEGEWFEVRLKDGTQLEVDALSGDIISKQIPAMSQRSLDWLGAVHTGEAHWFWSILWFLSSVCTLALGWTGFNIWNTRRTTKPTHAEVPGADADLDIVVASQGGTTWTIAKQWTKVFEGNGIRVNLCAMKAFRPNLACRKVVFMASTYGQGEAPEHLWSWKDLLSTWEFHPDAKAVVLALGDKKYRQFAQFGHDLAQELAGFQELPVLLHKVHRRTGADLLLGWQRTLEHLVLPDLALNAADEWRNQRETFQVVERISAGQMVWLRFKPVAPMEKQVESGDLMAVCPPEGNHERMYSLSMFKDQSAGMCVRIKPGGECSTWLGSLNVGNVLDARILKNLKFHLNTPKHGCRTTFICNGSGIGPFLGMIESLQDNSQATLVWGVKERNHTRFAEDILSQALNRGALTRLEVVTSKEATNNLKHVQGVFCSDEDLASTALSGQGRVMICGSLAMARDIETMFQESHNEAFQAARSEGRWQSDCY